MNDKIATMNTPPASTPAKDAQVAQPHRTEDSKQPPVTSEIKTAVKS